MSIPHGSYLPKSTKRKARRRARANRTVSKTVANRSKRTTRSKRKGKLTPGLIKGMKALLKSKHPRVSAAMKAGIRRRLKQERIKV